VPVYLNHPDTCTTNRPLNSHTNAHRIVRHPLVFGSVALLCLVNVECAAFLGCYLVRLIASFITAIEDQHTTAGQHHWNVTASHSILGVIWYAYLSIT
jgi:hypothetical protein